MCLAEKGGGKLAVKRRQIGGISREGRRKGEGSPFLRRHCRRLSSSAPPGGSLYLVAGGFLYLVAGGSLYLVALRGRHFALICTLLPDIRQGGLSDTNQAADAPPPYQPPCGASPLSLSPSLVRLASTPALPSPSDRQNSFFYLQSDLKSLSEFFLQLGSGKGASVIHNSLKLIGPTGYDLERVTHLNLKMGRPTG